MKQNYGVTLIKSNVIALVGIAIWGAVSYFFDYRLALIGIGIGYGVGKCFSKINIRESLASGILSVIITAIAILLGEMFSIILLISNEYDVSLITTITGIDYAAAFNIIVETSGVQSIIIYLVSLYQAYKIGSSKGIMTGTLNPSQEIDDGLNEDIA